MVNRAAETAHVLMLSTRRWPAVAVYPDSQKVGVFSDDPGARTSWPAAPATWTTGTGSASARAAQATAVSCSS